MYYHLLYNEETIAASSCVSVATALINKLGSVY